MLGGAGRSGSWPTIRKEWLKEHPACAVCNGIKKCEVHHKKPFDTNPELELDPTNFITLCRANSCHLIFGHLGNYKSFNYMVTNDTIYFNSKITNRP